MEYETKIYLEEILARVTNIEEKLGADKKTKEDKEESHSAE